MYIYIYCIDEYQQCDKNRIEFVVGLDKNKVILQTRVMYLTR